jgi:hypothetical protein
VRIRWVGHVTHVGDEMEMYKVLVGKPEGKGPLGIPRRRWEDGIRVDLRKTGCGCGILAFQDHLDGGSDWVIEGLTRRGRCVESRS